MRIAILGAGFCGLAVAWHLTQKNLGDIVIFDSLGIGKGASGVAAGLLHPYAGSQAKKNLRADEGLNATRELLKIAEKALGSSVIVSRGLIRLAISDKQKLDFAATASLYSDVHWLSENECQQKLGSLISHPGIFIDSAIVVDCEKYLHGLWTACAHQGVEFEKKEIKSLATLKGFDLVIIAMGAASKSLPELSKINITPIKGQVLELDWPEKKAPFLFPISSQAYLLMQPGNKKCIAGATFERDFDTEAPDLATALHEIMPKLQAFLPEMNSSLVLGCRAGIRASAPKHQPLMTKMDNHHWLLTGMGSKGLLYHALYAQELISQL